MWFFILSNHILFIHSILINKNGRCSASIMIEQDEKNTCMMGSKYLILYSLQNKILFTA